MTTTQKTFTENLLNGKVLTVTAVIESMDLDIDTIVDTWVSMDNFDGLDCEGVEL